MSKNLRPRPPAKAEDKGFKAGAAMSADEKSKSKEEMEADKPTLGQRIISEVVFFAALLGFMFVFMTLI